MKKFFLGFTLAEIMVSMAIIGIIAAVTIPAVVANYQKKTFVTSLQKNYSELEQNLSILSAESYSKGFNRSLLVTDINKFVTDYYRVSKNCGTDTQPCFASTYGTISGENTTPSNNVDFMAGSTGSSNSTDFLAGGGVAFSCKGVSFTTKSGTAICFIAATAPREANPDEGIEASAGTPVQVFIDVNGAEGPNIGGRDMFSFYIYNDFSIDDGSIENNTYIDSANVRAGSSVATRNTLFTNNCKSSYIGRGCFGKILNDKWEMNY